jgi:hypothetical protein
VGRVLEQPEPLIGSVYGFRWWRVGPGGSLRSPWYGGHRWDRGFNDARCLERRRFVPAWRSAEEHVAPDRECRCGFYGLWRPPRAERPTWVWELDVETSGSTHGLVFGVFEATGKILLATEGFRAQFAKPVAIAVGAGVSPSPDVDAVPLRLPMLCYRSAAALVDRWRGAVETSRGLTLPRSA